jgi:hypothetical protein
MLRRCFVLAAVMAVMAGAIPVRADEEAPAGMHNGKIVKVEGTKLTMTDKDGKNQHTHAVPATATVTCDGKACKLSDLKEGYMVTVTAEKKGEKTVITKVEAKKAG